MKNFPKLAMARFSQCIFDQFKDQKLIPMHNTNPQPFTQSELEHMIGRSFDSMLQDVDLGFTPDAGTVALRQTLVDYHYENISIGNVVTHAGAQEALYCAFYAILKEHDKVLAVTPVFEPLVQIPLNIGCDVRYVNLQPNNNWALDLDDVEKGFKQGCKLFIVNFPHNPTGATLTEVELLKIVELCKKYDVWLLSDEVFRGLEHSLDFRLPAVADLYDKGISVGVISKAFAIPGIRVGWLVCKNQKFLSKVIEVKGYLSICNSQIDEKLASVILQKTEVLTERNLKIILKNKKLLQSLNSILGLSVDINIPKVGCSCFARLNEAEVLSQMDSNIWVTKIAKQTCYLFYPSSLFKTKIEGIRIGFGQLGFGDMIRAVKSEPR